MQTILYQGKPREGGNWLALTPEFVGPVKEIGYEVRELVLRAEAEQAVREAQMRVWISVDDERKPEAGKPILMFLRTLTRGEDDNGRPYETEGAEVAMGEYRKSPGYDAHYFDCYTSPVSDNDWITHWMPLPAAPGDAS